MSIPEVDATRIEAALQQFDTEMRGTAAWENWEARGSYKYALQKNGLHYPPKEIVALATGLAKGLFSGGAEANNYLRRFGYEVGALRLPAEGEIQAALHDLLLARVPSLIEASEAYEVLAEQFGLSTQLRAIPMESSGENHWESRVRQAQRKLIDEGILDASEPNRWQLRPRGAPAVWIEKTHVRSRPDRREGEHALGRALWSPIRSKDGSDIYRNMRLVQPGDIILHLTDNTAFTGKSVAARTADPNFSGVEGAGWAGQCYRIPLRDFQLLSPPLTRENLLGNEGCRGTLQEIRRAHHNLFYESGLNLRQGAYLTEAPKTLVRVINEAALASTGHSFLDGPLIDSLIEASSTEEFSLNPAEPGADSQVWLYAPGRRAAYWDKFRSAGIAAIGWEYLGDLSAYSDVNAIRSRMTEVSNEPGSIVDANQCFDFSHRIKPGDRIFAKRGRREIIGFGVVSSGYRYDERRPYYKNVIEVDWQKSGSWPTASHRMLAMKTLTEIADEALVDELEALLDLIDDPVLPPPKPSSLNPPYTVRDFAAETAIQRGTIELWLSRLRRKKQLILQGPPGTGKTYVAERLARVLTSETHGLIDTVQFHPSYGYEDFMHGIRPIVEDGAMVFERMPGRFLRFCRHARTVPGEAPCIMIIDEINRANLARVFGELMYLLEYRNKMIPLAGEENPFGIPDNVHIIGTMNTADRSIAVVDHALRRRFSFVHLAPDYEVLKAQLAKHSLPADSLVEALQILNAAIGDRNYEIGISFFLSDGAALRGTLKDVWKGEIEPYLEEFFYDQPSKLEPFRWETLEKTTLAPWKSGN